MVELPMINCMGEVLGEEALSVGRGGLVWPGILAVVGAGMVKGLVFDGAVPGGLVGWVVSVPDGAVGRGNGGLAAKVPVVGIVNEPIDTGDLTASPQ